MPRRGSTSTVTAGGVGQGDLMVLAKASATLSVSPPLMLPLPAAIGSRSIMAVDGAVDDAVDAEAGVAVSAAASLTFEDPDSRTWHEVMG